MSGNENPKVFVLGIDGGTYDLIDPWVEEGLLPNFKRFREEGVKAPLITTIPPLTPSAWTSFMTGTSPARHGVLDFYELDESKKIRVARKNPGLKTIWRILSEAGKKVISVAVPFTYPPEPVNGIMVSGFLSPSLESNFTYPRSFRDELLRSIPDYRLSEDAKYSEREEDREAYAASIFRLLDIQFRTMRWLLETRKWDMFMTTVMAADHSQHWYWKYMDPGHPDYDEREASRFGDVILKSYQKIDEMLGFLMDNLPDETTIFIMSDHGAGPYYGGVYLNNYLRKKGFLKIKRTFPNLGKQLMYSLRITPQSIAQLALRAGLSRKMASMKGESRKRLASKLGFTYQDIDWERTRAYSFGYYGPIFINCEEGENFEGVRSEVTACLNELRDPRTGSPLITNLWKGEELYGAEKARSFPDIVISMGDFAYTSSVFAFPSHRIFADSMTYKSGEHRLNGVFGACGPGLRRNSVLSDISITDVTPTILNLFGMPATEGFDGRVIKEIWEKSGREGGNAARD